MLVTLWLAPWKENPLKLYMFSKGDSSSSHAIFSICWMPTNMHVDANILLIFYVHIKVRRISKKQSASYNYRLLLKIVQAINPFKKNLTHPCV